MSRKVLSEKPITLEKVHELLKKREKSHELNYIQRVTLEYALKFSKDFPHSEEIIDILGDKFNISREDGIQLVNLDPQRIEEVSLILDDHFDLEVKEEIMRLIHEHKAQYAASDLDKELPSDIESSTIKR